MILQDSKADISLASGYFNLTDDYSKLILERGRYKLAILSASPEVELYYKFFYAKFAPYAGQD